MTAPCPLRPWWRRRRSWLPAYLAALAASHLWQLGFPSRPTLSAPLPSPLEIVCFSGPPPPAGSTLPHLRFPLRAPGAGNDDRSVWNERSQSALLEEQLRSSSATGRILVARGPAVPAALHLTAARPALVRALVLDQPEGLPEFQLVGDALLNRAIRTAQSFALRLADLLLPHFGRLDAERGIRISAESRTRFEDTAAHLSRVRCPVLVVSRAAMHDGATDPAAEFHRLLPQSRLIHVPPGAPLDFHADLVRRSAGTALLPARDRAEPGRILRASEPRPPRPRFTGYRQLLVILLLAVAMQTSEDLTCIAAGILVGRGALGFTPATVGCLLGILLGDLGLYLLGRCLGRPALRRRPLRWLISESSLLESERAFHKRGAMIVFSARFLPGMRVPMYITAGLLRLPVGRFLSWLALAGLLWTPALVGLAALTGGQLMRLMESGLASGRTLLLALAAVWMLVHHVLPLSTWRGRRLACSRWIRFRRWEYWPRWIFYPPVLLYIFLLVLKHRGLRKLTVVNPGMPAGGGFLRERKSEIFQALRQAPELPPWTLLPACLGLHERLPAIEAFLERQGLHYPVVLKPDIGLRGHGVAIITSAGQAERYLGRAPVDIVVQPYLPGLEYGIFYLRHPGEPQGRVISLARKLHPRIQGDGRSTLERLLLSDPRAIGMAKFFLAKFAGRLDEVPAAGEQIPLTEVGNHCRGAVFASGMDLRTPELDATMDRIAKTYPGFYFGRFDIKAPDDDHIRRGVGLRIVELNGLTSEPVHMYDPSHSVFLAWRTLCRMWAEAFQIADANLAAGHSPLSWRQILSLWREYLDSEQLEARP